MLSYLSREPYVERDLTDARRLHARRRLASAAGIMALFDRAPPAADVRIRLNITTGQV